MSTYSFRKLDAASRPIQRRLFEDSPFDYVIGTFPTIDYLGSKRSLLHHLLPEVDRLTSPREVVLDLFAGSGPVSYSLQSQYVVYANDIQRYSYMICQSLLLPPPDYSPEKLFSSIRKHFLANFQELMDSWSEAVTLEKEFLSLEPTDETAQQYREWCEATPFWTASADLPQEFLKAKTYFSDASKKAYRDHPERRPYALFSTYFMNAYFGVRQCLEIDSLRYSIGRISEPSLRSILLSALMAAMSSTVSSTAHFAQFLKINGRNSAAHLFEKRSMSIWDFFLENLGRYLRMHDSILSGELNFPYQSLNRCFNKDYRSLLTDFEVGEIACVYADPPYFKEHYSRYYHVLETLVLYDYPEMTFNSRTGRTTEGRYRADRYTSPFGKKSAAPMALEVIAELSSSLSANLVLSYSDNSLVQLPELMRLVRRHYDDVRFVAIPHLHSKQGREDFAEVNEYILSASNKRK